MAVRTEHVFPNDVPPELCTFSHTRPVWRLEGAQAVVIAYEIDRGPKNQYGKIDGVLGRSEFGMEIVVSLADLVHVIGLSFDKACQLLKFFQNLTLKKSQADALLNQLSKSWEGEFDVHRQARRVPQDKRFNDEGRTCKVAELDDQIFELCGGVWSADLPPLEGSDDDFRLRCNELMRLMLDQQLFVFVTAASVKFPDGKTQTVGGTNNEAERSLRPAALARKTGRTNKTPKGARRQTILVSVLESLRLQVAEFTLPNLIEEIRKWGRTVKAVSLACWRN